MAVALGLGQLLLVAEGGAGAGEVGHAIAIGLANAEDELVVAGIAGAGTAWLVTVYQFPGRGALTWLLPLPLAIPTYIAAYVYADLLEAGGPLQAALRANLGWSAGGPRAGGYAARGLSVSVVDEFFV